MVLNMGCNAGLQLQCASIADDLWLSLPYIVVAVGSKTFTMGSRCSDAVEI